MLLVELSCNLIGSTLEEFNQSEGQKVARSEASVNPKSVAPTMGRLRTSKNRRLGNFVVLCMYPEHFSVGYSMAGERRRANGVDRHRHRHARSSKRATSETDVTRSRRTPVKVEISAYFQGREEEEDGFSDVQNAGGGAVGGELRSRGLGTRLARSRGRRVRIVVLLAIASTLLPSSFPISFFFRFLFFFLNHFFFFLFFTASSPVCWLFFFFDGVLVAVGIDCMAKSTCRMCNVSCLCLVVCDHKARLSMSTDTDCAE